MKADALDDLGCDFEFEKISYELPGSGVFVTMEYRYAPQAPEASDAAQ